MKKITLLSGMMAAMLMASCTSNASQEVQTNETDSLQITDPELWAAQNHKLELKADRGVMANPLELDEFIKEHGYGVHHLGFAVGERRDAVVNELIDRGYQKRVEHFYPGGSWTIIDSEQSLGVNLNIKPAM